MSLHLAARWNGEWVESVAVSCARPPAARALVGRRVDEVVRLVPMLFSLCGGAQAAAAAAACRAAGADDVPSLDGAAVERSLAAEAAREHLWRFLLDWPAVFGLPTDRDRFAALHRTLTMAKRPEAAAGVARDLLDLVEAAFPGLAAESGAGVDYVMDAGRGGGPLGAVLPRIIESHPLPCAPRCAELLPPLSAADWAGELGGLPSASFCRTPELGGAPRETGPLARRAQVPAVALLLARGQRVAARWLARVFDLAECAHRLNEPNDAARAPLLDAAAGGEHIGIACVETARGALIHAVKLDGDRVADYAIVAPTEWNFHPAGAFAREATGLLAASRDAAALQLKALALALDPCVEYDLVIEETANA